MLKLFKKTQAIELVPFINSFAQKSKKTRPYKRKYWNLARKFREYEEFREMILFSDSFTKDVFEDFCFFVQEKYKYRLATLKAYQQNLNVVLRQIETNIPLSFEFKDYRIQLEDSYAVSLSEAEIKKLNELRNLSIEAKAVRDIFVAGCVTGLRFSDYSRLTTENIEGDIIRVKTKKTGVEVKIPVHWIIRDVLFRNNGNFPLIKSQQAFNKMLKRICRKAGINDTIITEQTIGTKVVRKKYKKYEMVASHTARRSFATNLYLAGVPAAKIMLITGHKTESSFFKYIRIDKEQNAKELSDHPFFCKKDLEY